MILRSRFASFALFLSWLLLAVAQAPAFQGVDEQAERMVGAWFEQSGAPGVVAAVGIDGQIRWSRGFGFADLEQQVPMDPARTRLRFGSVIKPMTAYAAMLLVGEGALDLDRPIQTYVEFPEKQAPVTMRHLLTHQSGIRHYAADEFMSRDHYDTVAEGLAIFAGDPLEHAPGSAYRYSSYGYNLAGAVIEGAAGQSYLAFMAERVFAPLGMATVVPDQLSEIIPGRGRYYRSGPNGLENAPEVDNSYKWASGGYIGSAEDLVRFGMAMLNPDTLAPELREQMWREQPLASGESTEYALGWRLQTLDDGEKWIGHTGGSVGGTTTFWIVPRTGLVITMISNQSSFDFGEIALELARLFGGSAAAAD